MAATITLPVEPETTDQAALSWYERFKRSRPSGGFRAVYEMWAQTLLAREQALRHDVESEPAA